MGAIYTSWLLKCCLSNLNGISQKLHKYISNVTLQGGKLGTFISSGIEDCCLLALLLPNDRLVHLITCRHDIISYHNYLIDHVQVLHKGCSSFPSKNITIKFISKKLNSRHQQKGGGGASELFFHGVRNTSNQ